jgi:23S rRNA pseudouridine1911/1915/1917 synthase
VVKPAALRLVIPGALDGVRLDRALVALLPDVSRAELGRWIDAGRVRVEGDAKAPRAATKVRTGAVVLAEPLPPATTDLAPDPTVPFTVLFEDDAIVVVDKPAGVVVHPSKGHHAGTLVHGLLARTPLAPPDPYRPAAEDEDADAEREDDPSSEAAAEARLRPGIVHRIDRGTSGVLVIAKTALARERLKALFAAHDLERVYDAIAVGALPATADFDTPYGRHPTDRKAFTGKHARGATKRAVTHARVLERFEGAGCVRVACTLETGRTHQIRVHLSEAGAPLLGDELYGKPPRDPRVRAIGKALGRQALHARLLGFAHPTTGETVRFEAPWPEDFARAVEALRALG